MTEDNSAEETILLVDDNPTNLQLLFETLDGRGYKLLIAKDGKTALSIAAKAKPNIILLDIMMPEIDGYEVCRQLKSDPATAEIPVIFLSALTDTKDKVHGLDLGAVDYVTKPFQPDEVIARVNTHLTVYRLKKALDQKNQELQEANEFLEERVKKRTAQLQELNTAYQRFVPREFLNLLMKESILDVILGDQTAKQMTVLFSDIRGWTTLSEDMTAQQSFNFINAFLNRVSPVITAHQGFIDNFQGDGMMALFPASADDAVQAAIAMHAAVAEYNKERQKKGYQPIGIGVGLHIGDLMLGIIGHAERMQGTVVADAVNLASRLEGLTRVYGSSISISEPTLGQLTDPDQYKHRFVDKVQVKGKKDPVSVHEVFDSDPPAVIELKEKTKDDFEQGLCLYYDRKFSEASVKFNQVLEKHPEDRAARIYLKRSATYMVNGVPDDWMGVEILTQK
ncbi:MAG: response regulator [Deltaproteobacteria bacterium]|nr:response regulator [Deltaproteobacteria bacterium]